MNRHSASPKSPEIQLLSSDVSSQAVELRYLRRLFRKIGNQFDIELMREALSNDSEARGIEQAFLNRLQYLCQKHPDDPEWVHEFLMQANSHELDLEDEASEFFPLQSWEEAVARSSRK